MWGKFMKRKNEKISEFFLEVGVWGFRSRVEKDDHAIKHVDILDSSLVYRLHISFWEFGQIPMMQVACIYIYKNRIIRCYNIHMNLYTFSWTPPETRHCASSEPQPSVTTKGFFRATEVRESQGHKGDRRSRWPSWLGFCGFRYFSSQIFEEVKFSDGFRGRESSFSQGVTWGENKAYLPYGSVDSPTAAVVRPWKSFDRILQTSWTNFKSGFLWFTCETPSSFPLT